MDAIQNLLESGAANRSAQVDAMLNEDFVEVIDNEERE